MNKLFKRVKILIFHFSSLFFIPFWVFQKFLPRKKNLWVFGAWHGQKFSDNSKEFFLNIVENCKEINAVWISRDKEIVNELRSKGFESYTTNSFGGILKSLRAKLIIISSSKSDVNQFFINGARLIQIWHGAPMKKIGVSVRTSKARKILLYTQKILFPFLYEYSYNYVVSTSQCFNEILSKAFLVPQNNIIKSGYPRNDIFFKSLKSNFILNWDKQFNNPKKIIYLPTFRSTSEETDFFKDYGFDENKFIKILEKYNAIFITKGHFCDNQILSSNTSKRIINLTDAEVTEINPILKDIDILMTDYSGAYFDFLLTLRPIIFTAFDLNDYIEKNNGINFDYQKSVAGPIAKDWDEVIFNLQKFLSGDDSYFSKRQEKNIFFNKYNDGNSSQSLQIELKKLLNF